MEYRLLLWAILYATAIGWGTLDARDPVERSTGQRPQGPGLQEARTIILGASQPLKSLILRGEAHMGQSGRIPPWSVEMRFLFPKNYLRIDMMGHAIRYTGVSGRVPLYRFEKLDPDVSASATAGPHFLQEIQAEFASLALGMFAQVETTFTARVRPDAAQADGIRVVGPERFSVLVYLDATSHTPSRLRYSQTAPPTVRVGVQSGPVTAPPKWTDEVQEVVMLFEDRRVVDGLNVPHHITRSINGKIVEDIRFNRVVVNAPIDADGFARLAIQPSAAVGKK